MTFFTILTRYAKLCFYLNLQPDILIVNSIYILLSGYCSVSQECISIKKCPYTKELFSQVKSTSNPDEKAQLIQAIRLRVCGEPSDRTVCCEIDQGKIFKKFLVIFLVWSIPSFWWAIRIWVFFIQTSHRGWSTAKSMCKIL